MFEFYVWLFIGAIVVSSGITIGFVFTEGVLKALGLHA